MSLAPQLQPPLQSFRSIRPVSRKAVRQVLAETMRLDPEFDGFVMDYFKEVHFCFSSGMDRVSKTNLLLTKIQTAQLIEQLKGHFSANAHTSNLIDSILSISESKEDAEECLLRDRLETLQMKRARLLANGEYVSDLDKEIKSLKNALQRRPYLSDGDVIGDRYLLREVIGHGGFAKVWQAYDVRTETLVAVKVLREADEDKSRVDRFYRGAKCMQRIRHPHVVRILEGPACHEGFHYFVMDYLSGRDLYWQITNNKISRIDAIHAILPIGSALREFHVRQYYHRDVKPQNILFDYRQVAYLSDFDLVRAPDTNGGTRTTALGTYLYSSPQAQTNASQIDHRADIFAFARVVMFVLYGQQFDSSVMTRRDDFFAALDCSDAMRQILKRATEDDPALRPDCIVEFCDAVRAALDVGRAAVVPVAQVQALLAVREPVAVAEHKDPPRPVDTGQVRVTLPLSSSGSFDTAPVPQIAPPLRLLQRRSTWAAAGLAVIAVGVGTAVRWSSAPVEPKNAPLESRVASGVQPPRPDPPSAAAAAPASSQPEAAPMEPALPPFLAPAGLALSQGDYAKAQKQASRFVRTHPGEAWRILGRAACLQRHAALATQAMGLVEHAGERAWLVHLCQQMSLWWTSTRFVPAHEVNQLVSEAEQLFLHDRFAEARAKVVDLAGVDERAQRMLGCVACARHDCAGTRHHYGLLRSEKERDNLIDCCSNFGGVERETCAESLR